MVGWLVCRLIGLLIRAPPASRSPPLPAPLSQTSLAFLLVWSLYLHPTGLWLWRDNPNVGRTLVMLDNFVVSPGPVQIHERRGTEGFRPLPRSPELAPHFPCSHEVPPNFFRNLVAGGSVVPIMLLPRGSLPPPSLPLLPPFFFPLSLFVRVLVDPVSRERSLRMALMARTALFFFFLPFFFLPFFSGLGRGERCSREGRRGREERGFTRTL